MRILKDLTQIIRKTSQVPEITEEMLREHARNRTQWLKQRRLRRLGMIGPPMRIRPPEAKTTGMEYTRERREFVPHGMGRKQRWAQS